MHEWVQTVTGMLTSVGVVATLWVLIIEERRYRNDRRRERQDQARLVVFDIAPDVDTELRFGWEVVLATVRNLSDRPVFDVSIRLPDKEHIYLDNPFGDDYENPGYTKAVDAHGEFKALYANRQQKADPKWLDSVAICYVDANGARWSRTRSGDPEER